LFFFQIFSVLRVLEIGVQRTTSFSKFPTCQTFHLKADQHHSSDDIGENTIQATTATHCKSVPEGGNMIYNSSKGIAPFNNASV
jgi:hypothetical protein